MTPEQQSRADHLALVAAPIFAAFWPFVRDESDEVRGRATSFAFDIATALQKAAEERVAHE